jgi:hypothetical protein
MSDISPSDQPKLVERRHNPPKSSAADRRTIYLQRSGSIFRIYMGGAAIVSWYIAMTDPTALMYSVASTSDGASAIWALMLLGGCALVDAVFNDILSARWHWRVALRQRHYILVGMAFCYLAQIYTAFEFGRHISLAYSYLWNASLLMLAAFIDAHQRLKDAKCQIANNL